MDFNSELEKTLNSPESIQKYAESVKYQIEKIKTYHLAEGERLQKLKRHSRAAFHFHIAAHMLFYRGEYFEAYKSRCRNIDNSRHHPQRSLNGHFDAIRCIKHFDNYHLNNSDLQLILNHSIKAITISMKLNDERIPQAISYAAKAYEQMAELKTDILKADDLASAFEMYSLLSNHLKSDHLYQKNNTISKLKHLGISIRYISNDDSYISKGIALIESMQSHDNIDLVESCTEKLRLRLEQSPKKQAVNINDFLFDGIYERKFDNRLDDYSYLQCSSMNVTRLI